MFQSTEISKYEVITILIKLGLTRSACRCEKVLRRCGNPDTGA